MDAHNISPTLSAAVDQMMDAIARHRAVVATIDTMTGDEPEWETMLASETSAYKAVCQTVPTTLDGICQKASYMAEVGVAGFPAEHVNAALISFKTAASSLGKVAPADARDPLLEAINAYVTARDDGYKMPYGTDEEIAAYEAYYEKCMPLFWNIQGLAPTTMAGAARAIEFLRAESKGGTSALEDSLFDGVTAFLEGRVA